MTGSTLKQQLQRLTTSIEKATDNQKAAAMIQLVSLQNTITIQKAVGAETRSFNQIFHSDKVSRAEVMETLVTYLNLMLRQMFSKDRGVEIGQVVLFVDEILKIQHLTIEDVICFVNGMKSGRYGKIYGKIDLAVLNEWFDIYLDERDDAFHRARSSKQYESWNYERTNIIEPVRNIEKHTAQLFGKSVQRETYEQFTKRTGNVIEGQ